MTRLMGAGGELTYPDGTSPHIPGAQPAYHPFKYLLQIAHISLLCTVCDKEIWVFVEFTHKKKRMYYVI